MYTLRIICYHPSATGRLCSENVQERTLSFGPSSLIRRIPANTTFEKLLVFGLGSGEPRELLAVLMSIHQFPSHHRPDRHSRALGQRDEDRQQCCKEAKLHLRYCQLDPWLLDGQWYLAIAAHCC